MSVAQPGLADGPPRPEPPPVLQPALLTISFNGGPAGEPVLLLKDSDGSLYAPADLLIAWRLRAPPAPAFSRDGIAWIALGGIDRLRARLDEGAQTLAVEASPDLIEPTRLYYGRSDPGPMTPSGAGGFLNYDLFTRGGGGSGGVRVDGDAELGAFTPVGVGVTGVLGGVGAGGGRLVRLDSNWTVDDPTRMRSLRLGDSVSHGGIGGAPLRFGGVQFASNFETAPGYLTQPMPTISGAAATASAVDVYINDALRARREVPAGPFELSGVPLAGGATQVRLLVRDLLGRETWITQSFYAGAGLLRAGLQDFSYEAGFLRARFAERSNDYGPLLLSGTHRYGLTDGLTGALHVEAAGAVRQVGAAASFVVPGFGIADVNASVSRSNAGGGSRVAVGLLRQAAALSVSIDGEFSSAGYRAVEQFREHLPPAALVRASAGLPIGPGSVSLSWLWRDARDEKDVQWVGASASFRLGDLGTVQVAGRRSLQGDAGSVGQLALSLPFGRRSVARAGVTRDRNGTTADAFVQHNAPSDEGIGYALGVSRGRIDRADARVTAQTAVGAYEATVDVVAGRARVGAGASGALGLIDGQVFPARRLSGSFASVRVGDYAGVRVFADNQLIGRTDRDGRVIVPQLRPYDRNAIRIEAEDLPLDTLVPAVERGVRPFSRSGTLIDFAVRPAYGATMTLIQEDGKPLPAGATVRLADGGEEVAVAPDGEVYLTGLAASNVLVAHWPGGGCRALVPFRPGLDPQPRLGRFTCGGAGR